MFSEFFKPIVWISFSGILKYIGKGVRMVNGKF